MDKLKMYAKILLNLLIACVTIFVIIYIVPSLLKFFMPFVIAWFIAMIANPVVRFMEKRVKILRKHSSAIIIIGVLAGVVTLLVLGVNTLIKELSSLLNDMPELYLTLEEQLNLASDKLKGFYDLLPGNFQSVIDSLSNNLSEYGKNFFANFKMPSINDAGLVVKNVAEVLFLSIITIIASYFFIAERENMINAGRKIMPSWITEKYRMITDNFKIAVGGYFKAQIKIMFVITFILFVGFEIMRIDYSFLLAFGIAFVDLLPVFGTGAIIWPWAAFQFILGDYMKGIGLVFLYLICQIGRQVLQPKMVGDSIGISPFMTLFFMFVGYKIKGILGLIFGIPIGMVIINFYRAGMFDNIIRSLKIVAHDINEFRKM